MSVTCSVRVQLHSASRQWADPSPHQGSWEKATAAGHCRPVRTGSWWEGAPWPRTGPRFPQKTASKGRGPWWPCSGRHQLPACAIGECKVVRLTAALLPLALRLIKRLSSALRDGSSVRRSSQSVRSLATSSAASRPAGTEASTSFERPSSNIEYSLLPLAMPCQYCAVAVIMRKRRLGTRSSVLTG